MKNAKYAMLCLTTNLGFKFIKPQVQGMSLSTWGVVRRELELKYRDLVQVSQARPSERRKRSELK